MFVRNTIFLDDLDEIKNIHEELNFFLSDRSYYRENFLNIYFLFVEINLFLKGESEKCCLDRIYILRPFTDNELMEMKHEIEELLKYRDLETVEKLYNDIYGDEK